MVNGLALRRERKKGESEGDEEGFKREREWVVVWVDGKYLWGGGWNLECG